MQHFPRRGVQYGARSIDVVYQLAAVVMQHNFSEYLRWVALDLLAQVGCFCKPSLQPVYNNGVVLHSAGSYDDSIIIKFSRRDGSNRAYQS